ncbi:hypothetical protein AHF37_07417 [Paragonimus kellicotti]|nr:hypothetical protein AHF37_07417 [Paragonimus kellicotti]
MIASLQDFTNELYRTVLDEQGPCLINTYFSPTSVYLGLLATMMGSQGRTREQIVKAINLDRNIEETKSHDLLSKRMAGLLRPIPRCITGGTTQSVYVIGANRMFYSAGLNISPQYLKDIERYYGFESEFRHFVEYPERDRYGINCWMSQQMAQTVPELMPPGSITSETKFVVINGMYFKACLINTYFSPTSVYLGLLATMMGSQGRTREQIVKAINLDRNIEETKSHDLLSKRMAGLLRPIPRCITGGTTQSVYVIGANRMFYSAGLNISPQYLKDIERYYGFESEFRHFVEYPERDRYGINCWMSQQMAQTVPELMPPGSITSETKFVVINGMYFKGFLVTR